MAKTYLNTAACGLLDEASVKIATDLYHDMLTNSSTAAEAIRDNRMQAIHEAVAELMSAPVANIALIPNFSWALNAIVQSLKGTEKVLLYKNDFPSVLEPFRINQFDITWIDAVDGFTIDVTEVKELALSNKVDIIVISHVQWQSGYKIDIKELGTFCKQHDIIFIVDATQSLGSVHTQIDKLDVDILIASNYKWMNAGFGTGVMYISDSFLSNYEPVVAGFGSYAMPGNTYKYVPSAKSYEPGHLNLHGFLIMESAIKRKLETGLEKIEEHNRQLTQLLLDNLGDLPLVGTADTGNRSSIVVIKDADDNLYRYLADNDIVVTGRNNTVRISMHFYNTEADVHKLLICLGEYANRQHRYIV